ncbi:MAG: hypothetical protein LJE69_09750 [Thiohalocapsa sp.]|uniref:hypothetical protein n=1 Tax=Thiohalocapsa sp. TaxID=2497641 RepID=UPI0025FDB742|nr:hypothetical protein [Thiohalocapsa sp.]MCG6941521.1 hypothetical protein [Thiohalocapsa sp.]
MKVVLLVGLCTAIWLNPAKAETIVYAPKGVPVGASHTFTASHAQPGQLVLVQSRNELYTLGEGFGAYLGAVVWMNVGADTECAYLIKNPPEYSAALAEVEAFVSQFEFDDGDWNDLMLSTTTQAKEEAEEFVGNFLAAARREDHSLDARCGFLAGQLASMFAVGRQRWLSAVREFQPK